MDSSLFTFEVECTEKLSTRNKSKVNQWQCEQDEKAFAIDWNKTPSLIKK